MPFEEILPRKGAGSSSTFSKQVRCAIYIWKNNIRLCIVIGGDISSFIGIKSGGDVKIDLGHGTDTGKLQIEKAPKDGKAYYKVQPNGKNAERNDVRILVTIPPYLTDSITDKQTNLNICQHMVRDKVLIVTLHEDLLQNPNQYNVDVDKDNILGF
tara:strand:- start:81 stop:548 length:468 start_codon:yes stop_codon:yes gene_type:complete